jgi:hypothetical protein
VICSGAAPTGSFSGIILHTFFAVVGLFFYYKTFGRLGRLADGDPHDAS